MFELVTDDTCDTCHLSLSEYSKKMAWKTILGDG